MNRQVVNAVSRMRIPDDEPLFTIRRDVSSGVNTRMQAAGIKENQCVSLTNIDLITPGIRHKRLGSVRIANDKGSDSIVGLFNYRRQGYTDNLIMVEDTHLWASEAEANWVAVKTDFTADTDVGIIQVKESGLVPDDVLMVNVNGHNWFRFHKASTDIWNTQDLGNTAGTGSDSPPASTVGAWYGNRFWVLKDDQLYFSAAYSADYSSAFDTVSDVYRIPVGDERGIIPTRDTGMVIMGADAIWGIAPSATPAVTDKPEPLVTSHGVVSKIGWVNAGDDIYYFAQDGFRALRRTIQDKLQTGTQYPISYLLEDEFDEIDWTYIDRLSMEYYDNRIFIVVPTGAATFKTWVYYPATNSFVIWSGQSPRCWAKHKISGEERLYYGKHGDGVVYRALYGYTDEGTTTIDGTAISLEEEGREEDFGQPLVYKIGGEVEFEVAVSGNYNLVVSAKVDGSNYVELGKINLVSSTAPTLPVALPFTLTADYTKREKFHLDQLGRFRTIQFKVENDSSNTELIKYYSYQAMTFPERYENE